MVVTTWIRLKMSQKLPQALDQLTNECRIWRVRGEPKGEIQATDGRDPVTFLTEFSTDHKPIRDRDGQTGAPVAP